LSAIASNKRSEGRAEAVLQRVTVTIDDELMDALERYMLAGGHQNRSEAVRDLVRAGLMKEVDDADDMSRSCVGALVYVYDPAIRQLSRRLLEEHHAHVQMSVVGSHVGLRISESKSKKPSNVRIAVNNILRFNGFSPRFSYKSGPRRPSPFANSTKRLEQQILELAGFGKPYCRIKWIFSSAGFPLNH
jgi:nickel-responsive transcriptional regulator NikR